LELQKLQLDFQQVTFAHISGAAAGFTDVHGFLEAVKILFGELESGFGQNNIDELLSDVELELAFGIGNLRADHGCGVARGRKAVLTFFAAFEEIAGTDVELGGVVQIIVVEVVGLKDGKELGVPSERWVGTKVGGDFLGLVLQDSGTEGEKGVVVLESKAQRVIESDVRRCGRILSSGRSGRNGCRVSRRQRFLCGSACEHGQNPCGESNSNSHFPRYLLGSGESPRKLVERKITNREFRSERRRSAWGSDGKGKRRDCGMGAPGFEPANGRGKLNKQSRSDDRMTGGSAKLTNVGARAVRS
jgi:hypothetical protein